MSSVRVVSSRKISAVECRHPQLLHGRLLFTPVFSVFTYKRTQSGSIGTSPALRQRLHGGSLICRLRTTPHMRCSSALALPITRSRSRCGERRFTTRSRLNRVRSTTRPPTRRCTTPQLPVIRRVDKRVSRSTCIGCSTRVARKITAKRSPRITTQAQWCTATPIQRSQNRRLRGAETRLALPSHPRRVHNRQRRPVSRVQVPSHHRRTRSLSAAALSSVAIERGAQ